MILKFVNVDKRFVRTFERSNTFANAYERSQKINVNVQNSKFGYFAYFHFSNQIFSILLHPFLFY